MDFVWGFLFGFVVVFGFFGGCFFCVCVILVIGVFLVADESEELSQSEVTLQELRCCCNVNQGTDGLSLARDLGATEQCVCPGEEEAQG